MCPSTYTEFIRRVYFRRGKEVVKIKNNLKNPLLTKTTLLKMSSGMLLLFQE